MASAGKDNAKSSIGLMIQMQPADGKSGDRRQVYSSLLFIVLMLFYGGFLWLWATHYPLYIAIMSALGVDAWHFPFLDTMGPLSWIECHRRGIDVFVVNPCDPLNRLFNYSPLILDFPDFGLRVRDTFAIGLSIALLFLTALPFIFRPGTVHALVLACFACLSPSVLFAVERARLRRAARPLAGATRLSGQRRPEDPDRGRRSVDLCPPPWRQLAALGDPAGLSCLTARRPRAAATSGSPRHCRRF